MTVSIIVPVYKADEFLSAALASIEAQTYNDIELIVIDDSQGSGAAAARNRGLAKATGDYVAFCDADDYLAPDAIERLVAAMEGVDMACGSFRKFGTFEQVVSHPSAVLDMRELAQYVMGNLKNPRSNQMLSGCWAKMYRREKVGEFPDLTTAEDMAFNFSYLKLCKKVRFIDSVVYHNRKREGSLSTTFKESDKPGLFGFLEALSYVKMFMLKHHYELTIDMAIDNSKVYHSLLYFTRICQQTGKPMREMLMELYP